MRKTEKCVSWAVYRKILHGKTTGMNVVCEQGEWEALELSQPGHYTLVRAGITNEGEAERLARSSSMDGSDKAADLKVPRRL